MGVVVFARNSTRRRKEHKKIKTRKRKRRRVTDKVISLPTPRGDVEDVEVKSGLKMSKTERSRLRKREFNLRMLRDNQKCDSNRTKLVNLAVTAGVLMTEQASSFLADIKPLLDKGRLSSFVVMANAKYTKPANRAELHRRLEEDGNGWVKAHIVEPIDGENTRKFVLRILAYFDITHYFDINKQFLGFPIYSPAHTKVKLHYFDKKKANAWHDTYGWIARTAPMWYNLIEQDGDAFHQIKVWSYDEEAIEQEA
jgi:hypothetical protein